MTAVASERSAPTPVRALAVTRIAELARDYARWAHLCYTIRDKQGHLRPLALNSIQSAIGRAEREQLRETGRVRLFILKARQGGVSTDQQGRNLHQIWSEPNFDALTLAHTTGDTDKLFGITQRAIEHFPRPLLPALGERSAKEVSFPGLDTHFFTGTAGAKRTGRGLTLKRFHGSEFAFWDDPEGTLGTITPGLVPEGSIAVLETTASGFDSLAHNFWREAETRGYKPIFFPWWECDRDNYRRPLEAPDELGELSGEEQELQRAHGLDLEQIKWRRQQISELTRATFLTEYAEDAESCWAAAGGMFYDVEILKALMLKAPEPIETHMNGALRVYSELLPGERAIIGSDTAEGTGGDRSTWAARAFPSWRLLADYESNRATPKELAGILNTWGRKFGCALLVVEKNAHGITVLRELRDDLQYPVDRIYHRALLDEQQTEMKTRIGWATTGESKPLLLDAGRELFAAAFKGLAGVPSRSALRDAFGVRRGDDGKYDLNGKDVLVAEMLAWIGRSAPSDTGMLDYYVAQVAALKAKREQEN
jgi:hypothetical protein